MAPGFVAQLWGYNGQSPGPTIEVVEGDKVRIFVTNRLPEHTSVHWHGQRLPNGMDGVPEGEHNRRFPVKPLSMSCIARRPERLCTTLTLMKWCKWLWGCTACGLPTPNSLTLLIDEVDRDFCFLLNAFDIEPGSKTPKVNTMTDFNIWVMEQPRLFRD